MVNPRLVNRRARRRLPRCAVGGQRGSWASNTRGFQSSFTDDPEMSGDLPFDALRRRIITRPPSAITQVSDWDVEHM